MNQNSDKIILDLCGATGSWSRFYKEAGYDVRIVTAPHSDVRTWTIYPIGSREVLSFNPSMENRAVSTMEIPVEKIYGILAAPPCTQFSMARTTPKVPRDLAKGMEVVEACLQIVWAVRKRHRLAFWALENPLGYLRQFLGRPYLTFQPNEYGDPHTKKTDVWGFFEIPRKRPIEIPDDVKRSLAVNNRIMPQLPDGYDNHKKTGERSQAARRSMTPPGFAKAFFKANR